MTDATLRRMQLAEAVLHAFVAALPERHGRPPEDEEKARRRRQEEELHAALLADYRTAVRAQLGPVAAVVCSVPRRRRCSLRWDGHVCALGPGHEIGHACGCGAVGDVPGRGRAAMSFARPREAGAARPQPCPRCGEVAFSWGPAGEPQRRCAGPAGCGQAWTPCDVDSSALESALRPVAPVVDDDAEPRTLAPADLAAARTDSARPAVVEVGGSSCRRRPYAAGGPDHSRPWSPPGRMHSPGAGATAGFLVAGRPSGIGIVHLFGRPGQWSLCEEACWLEVQRAECVNALTWICVACQAIAAESEQPVVADPARQLAERRQDQAIAVLAGRCPVCDGDLSDRTRSPGGWAHCRACRRGWRVQAGRDGQPALSGRDWPDRGQPAAAAAAAIS